MIGLLHGVVVCACVGAFDGTTVVVKSAVLTTFFRIRRSATHHALSGARVFVGLVFLIGEANGLRGGQLVVI